jgi:hypothetical protein
MVCTTCSCSDDGLNDSSISGLGPLSSFGTLSLGLCFGSRFRRWCGPSLRGPFMPHNNGICKGRQEPRALMTWKEAGVMDGFLSYKYHTFIWEGFV